jgi:hypothetical protein
VIKILNAQTIAPFQIKLQFNDGTEEMFNASDYLVQHNGPLLDALRDSDYFNRFFIDAGALCWPNGLELSPQRLHELVSSTLIV